MLSLTQNKVNFNLGLLAFVLIASFHSLLKGPKHT
jgi:hypothetical protein